MVLQVHQHVAFADRVQSFVKNVADVFDKRRDRSKCPRCKGSGLLNNSNSWFSAQKPVTNEHCWFCEGIGSMPIVGLNGYMIARASPAFHTRDMRPCSSKPSVQGHLFLGKYPGTRCKFTTFKQCEYPEELLHDNSKIPEWLSGEFMDISVAPVKVRPALSSTGKVRKSSRDVHTRLSTRYKSRDIRTDRDTVHQVQGSIQRHPRQIGTPKSRAQTLKSSPREPSVQGTGPGLESGGRKILGSKNDSPSPVITITASSNQVYGPNLVTLSKPSTGNLKRTQQRRERNRIREKENREAVKRARKTLEPLQVTTTCSSFEVEQFDTSGNNSPGNAWSFTESSSWFGLQASRIPWLQPLKGSEYSWANQMVYGSIKERSSPRITATKA